MDAGRFMLGFPASLGFGVGGRSWSYSNFLASMVQPDVQMQPDVIMSPKTLVFLDRVQDEPGVSDSEDSILWAPRPHARP